MIRILTILLLTAVSCKSYEGKRTYTNRRNSECDIKIIPALPQEKDSYELIGRCSASGAIMIKDGSSKAFDRVVKCACQRGGNAVVIDGIEHKGYDTYDAYSGISGYQRTGSVVKGVVIRLK